MIETYLLQYLAAFAEHKNLSDVAKAMNVTQPTVSRAMQKLEQELGLRLFVRTKNTIALTATGSLAVEYAAKQIDAQNEMVTALGDFDRASRRLHFGSIAAAPRRLLTATAHTVYGEHAVSSDIYEEEEPLLRGVDDGSYQLAVLLRPIDDDVHYSQFYARETLSAILPKDHALSGSGAISFADLSGEKILTHGGIGFWNALCRAKIPDACFISMNDLSALKTIVDASTLVAFCSNLTPYDKADRVIVPISDAEASAEYWLVCKAQEREWLKDVLGALRGNPPQRG